MNLQGLCHQGSQDSGDVISTTKKKEENNKTYNSDRSDEKDHSEQCSHEKAFYLAKRLQNCTSIVNSKSQEYINLPRGFRVLDRE